MRADLAIDQLEAAPSLGDLLTEAGSELGEQVAMFPSGCFSVEVQLGDLSCKHCAALGIKRSNIALGVLYLARDAKKLGSSPFAGDGSINLAMIVKQTLQGFGVAATVGLIGAGHQQSEVLLFRVIAREVGVDALGNIAEEGLEARRWVELFSFMGIAECGIMGLLRALARLLSSAPGRVRVVEGDFALGDARFQIVEFGIKDTDLAKITTFEGLQLSADLGKLGLALGERRANSGKLLALVEEGLVVRSLLENDFCWHAASREGKL